MEAIRKIAEISLVLGVISFSVRSGDVFSGGMIRPKLFEIALLVATLATSVFLLRNRQGISTFWRTQKPALGAVALFLFGTLLAGAWGALFFGTNPTMGMVIEYGRIGAAAATFVLMLFWLTRNPQLKKWVVAAFFSPLLYAPTLFFPPLADKLGMIELSGRLRGLHNDPNYFATLLLVTLSLLLTHAFYGKGKLLRALSLFGSIAIAGLIWWAGSRGSWLAMITGLALIITLIERRSPKRMAIAWLLLFAVFFSGFLLAPSRAQKFALTKILPASTQTIQEKGIGSLPEALREKSPIWGGRSTPKEGRFTVWPQYAKKVLRSPLGFGPGYLARSPVLVEGGKPLASHNIVLETLLVSGWIGFGAVVFLAIKIVRALSTTFKENFSWQAAGVAGALMTLAIALFFLESLALRWLWVLAALALSSSSSIRNNSR